MLVASEKVIIRITSGSSSFYSIPHVLMYSLSFFITQWNICLNLSKNQPVLRITKTCLPSITSPTTGLDNGRSNTFWSTFLSRHRSRNLNDLSGNTKPYDKSCELSRYAFLRMVIVAASFRPFSSTLTMACWPNSLVCCGIAKCGARQLMFDPRWTSSRWITAAGRNSACSRVIKKGPLYTPFWTELEEINMQRSTNLNMHISAQSKNLSVKYADRRTVFFDGVHTHHNLKGTSRNGAHTSREYP